MQTIYKPRAHFVQTMKLVTWVTLGGADPAQSLLHLSCSLLTTTCGKPAHIVWGLQDNFCDRRFWVSWCT